MTVPLTELPAGATAIVSTLTISPARIDKLAALGVLPGIELRVQQQQPVVVIECGETVLAIERELAQGILVSRTAPGGDGARFRGASPGR